MNSFMDKFQSMTVFVDASMLRSFYTQALDQVNEFNRSLIAHINRRNTLFTVNEEEVASWGTLVLLIALAYVAHRYLFRSYAFLIHLLRRRSKCGNLKQLNDVVNVQLLGSVLSGDSEEIAEFRRKLVKHVTSSKIFERVANEDEISFDAARCRQLTSHRMRAVLASQLLSVYQITDDPLRFIAAHEVLASSTDPNVVYLFSVHFNLFGGSVLRLGSDEQRQLWLPRIESFDASCAPGSFALTEVRHGVLSGMFLDTTATYDGERKEFVINTPSRDAVKNWISFGARSSLTSVVFARLIMPDGVDEGIHAFLVSLRADGVELEDMGLKPALNGNDNVRITFKNVRVPRTALLSRYSQVDESGVFSSEIKDKRQRFFRVADQLMSGRMCIGAASLVLGKLAVAMALHYARSKQQNRGETARASLFSNLTQRMLLVPAIARLYALSLLVNDTKHRFARMQTASDVSLGERIASTAQVCGVKSYATTYATRLVDQIRNSVGGQSLLCVNGLSQLCAVASSLCVVEGDAAVLAQKHVKDYIRMEQRRSWLGNVGLFLRLKCRLAYRRAIALAVHVSVDDLHWQQTLLRARLEAKMLALLGALQSETRDANGSCLSTMDSWSLRCLDRVNQVHDARIELMAFERLMRVTGRVKAKDVAAELRAQASLFALDCIRHDAAFLQAKQLISGSDYEAVERAVRNACADVSEGRVESIVSAFNLPENALNQIPIYRGECL